MKKKFNNGDLVQTNTHAVYVYQDTQESLSGLEGKVIDNTDYPYNISVEVKLQSGEKVIVGYSEFELNKLKKIK